MYHSPNPRPVERGSKEKRGMGLGASWTRDKSAFLKAPQMVKELVKEQKR